MTNQDKAPTREQLQEVLALREAATPGLYEVSDMLCQGDAVGGGFHVASWKEFCLLDSKGRSICDTLNRDSGLTEVIVPIGMESYSAYDKPSEQDMKFIAGACNLIGPLAQEALQRREQEPVAWMTDDGRVCTSETKATSMPKQVASSFSIPLYSHPQPTPTPPDRKGLVEKLRNNLRLDDQPYYTQDGKPASLEKMIAAEPEWTASRWRFMDQLLRECLAHLSAGVSAPEGVTREPDAITPIQVLEWIDEADEAWRNYDEGEINWSLFNATFIANKAFALGQQSQQRWQHVANEYADELCNALQWMKNVKEGISTIEAAIEDTQKGLARCQMLTTASTGGQHGQ